MLAAGIDGVNNRIEPGDAVAGDPHDLPTGEKTARGIERIPETLGEAANALAADSFFAELLPQSRYRSHVHRHREFDVRRP